MGGRPQGFINSLLERLAGDARALATEAVNAAELELWGVHVRGFLERYFSNGSVEGWLKPLIMNTKDLGILREASYQLFHQVTAIALDWVPDMQKSIATVADALQRSATALAAAEASAARPSDDSSRSASASKALPKIFIGSSREGLEVARAIQEELQGDAYSTIWNQGVFGLSEGTLETLVGRAEEFDFAILVLTPDDVTTKRGNTANAARDNVLFEFGLFLGVLGRKRTFAVRSNAPLDMPTDLAGVSVAWFAPDQELPAAVGAACTQIRRELRKSGCREKLRGRAPDDDDAARTVPSDGAHPNEARTNASSGDGAPAGLNVEAPTPTSPSTFAPPISNEAAAILRKRGELWEISFFLQVVRDEFASRSSRREALDLGLVDGDRISLDDHGAVDWMRDQYRSVSRLTTNLHALFNIAVPAAMGPAGQPADPQALVRVARRLGHEYEHTLDWGLGWRCLLVSDIFDKVIEIGSSAGLALATAFSTWLDVSAAAVERCRAGHLPGDGVVRLTFQLDMPEGFSDAMKAEMNRIGEHFDTA